MQHSVRGVSADQSAYLNACRGGAAIIVLIAHALAIFNRGSAPVWSAFATAAVMVFFALSGFLIQISLARSIADNRPANFVAARINRIVPPFVFAIALTVILWAIAPLAFTTGTRTFATATVRDSFSLAGLAPTILFLNGFAGPTLSANGPLWSLSFEAFYYALAFFGGLAITRRWLTVPIVLVASMLCLRNPGFAVLGLVWLAGFMLSRRHAENRLPRWPQLPFIAAALPVLAWQLTHPLSDVALISWQLAAGLAFAVHLLWVLRAETLPRTGLLAPTSAWSYTLYVIHFPLLLLMFGSLPARPWLALPAALSVALLAALIGPRLEAVRLIPRIHR